MQQYVQNWLSLPVDAPLLHQLASSLLTMFTGGGGHSSDWCSQSVCLLFWLLIRFEARDVLRPIFFDPTYGTLWLHHLNWNRLQSACTWFSFALKRKETIYGIRILVWNRHSLHMAENSFTGNRFVWFDALMPLDPRSRRRGGTARAINQRHAVGFRWGKKKVEGFLTWRRKTACTKFY